MLDGERATLICVMNLTLNRASLTSRGESVIDETTFRRIDSSRRDSTRHTGTTCVTMCDIQRDAGQLLEAQAEAGQALLLLEVLVTNLVSGFVIWNVAFVLERHTHCNRSVMLTNKPCSDMILTKCYARVQHDAGLSRVGQAAAGLVLPRQAILLTGWVLEFSWRTGEFAGQRRGGFGCMKGRRSHCYWRGHHPFRRNSSRACNQSTRKIKT